MAISELRRPGNVKGIFMPTLPERGKIKIGKKGEKRDSQRGTSYQPPQKLPYFQVTTLEIEADGNFKRDDRIHAIIGDKPTRLPIELRYNDLSLNFSDRLACYNNQATVWCTGNGEIAERRTGTGNATTEVSCPCPRLDPDYDPKEICKPNGVLSCVISGASGVGGVWKFRTSSYNSIQAIRAALAEIKSITGGLLANIPLALVLRTKKNKKGQTIYFVTLDYEGTALGLRDHSTHLLIENRRWMEQTEAEIKRLSGDPLFGDPEEEEETRAEYYPDNAAEGADAVTKAHDGTPRVVNENSGTPQGQSASETTPKVSTARDAAESHAVTDEGHNSAAAAVLNIKDETGSAPASKAEPRTDQQSNHISVSGNRTTDAIETQGKALPSITDILDEAL